MAIRDEGTSVLDEFDKDGALLETSELAAESVSTRKHALKRTGILVGGGLAIGALPVALSIGQGGIPASDIKILNYALTLEYLEAAFYEEAVAGGALTGSLANFAQVVSGHENAHVAALEKALGSKAIKKPTFDFKGTTDDSGTFAKTAQTLEDTGVAAYLGQVTKIKTAAILMAAGSILPIESRHAAWIRDIQGRGQSPVPAPDGFDAGKPMSEILAAVKATGFIQ
ncbi:hypothetical protein DSM112329_02728 [Paraconexibacter sp. AEG42_29]|uniref:Ferritin-like domain-containing protein n=1 Tax=Paraconexibacter sp. AEG42_29 TaxID=2997339 RepID=A0AAU7AW06_9ACTN